MNEATWGTPDPQYYQSSTLPEWARQYRQETDEAIPEHQENGSWSVQPQRERPRSYSNSPHLFHQVPPIYPQPTYGSSDGYSHPQAPVIASHRTSYVSPHIPPPSHSFDVESTNHRRGTSMPSLNLGSVVPVGSTYLFQQPTSAQPPASTSQVSLTQGWPGQHIQALPQLEGRQALPSDHAHTSAFVRGHPAQSMPINAFEEQPPSQQNPKDGEHGQSAIHTFPIPLHSPGQPINDPIAILSSNWQGASHTQSLNGHGLTPSAPYALKNNGVPEPHSTTPDSFPHPDTQYNEAIHTDSVYPLPHMQLPPSNGYLNGWPTSQQDAHIPSMVSTGMPSQQFEAGGLQANLDPSSSISPVSDAMRHPSTRIAPSQQSAQNYIHQTAFPLHLNEDTHIQSSTTSPYSEGYSNGQYPTMPYTPSVGNPSPSLGQLAHHARNEYFVDYQDTLDEQSYRSAPYQHVVPAISPASANGQPAASSSKKGKSKAGKVQRQTRQYEGVCNHCQKHFATVTLRGLDADFSQPYYLQYYCVVCAPSVLAISLGKSVNLSKADDKQKGKFNRKRIRSTDPSSPALCDVCQRAAAYGGPVPLDLEKELTFHTEVVCDQCASRYTRCSDCGGGGGARCGVGKWRCKELFAEGRKTCSLNHSRQSSVSSMQYSIMRIRDIPPEEKPELLNKCRRVFELSLLNTLAVPEVLERGTAMADTFADVQDKVEKGWLEGIKVFEDDKEETEGLRRYLGVRWSAPKPRKSTSASSRKASDEKAGQLSSPDDPQDPVTSEQMIIPGMNVAGFVTAEWAMTQGTLYISISVPYSTGEQYEGAAHLINMLQTRAQREREELLADLEAAGRGAESATIPPVEHCFTMIFFTSDSKYLAFLESKRQLLPLERYLQKYPKTDPKIFPPYRPMFISPERAASLTCIVRHISTQPSDIIKQKAARSSAKQQKSKTASAS